MPESPHLIAPPRKIDLGKIIDPYSFDVLTSDASTEALDIACEIGDGLDILDSWDRKMVLKRRIHGCVTGEFNVPSPSLFETFEVVVNPNVPSFLVVTYYPHFLPHMRMIRESLEPRWKTRTRTLRQLHAVGRYPY